MSELQPNPRDAYANTIVFKVIEWYDQLGKMLWDVETMLTVMRVKGRVTGKEAEELTTLLARTGTGITRFSSTYFLPADEMKMTKYEEAEASLEDADTPESDYGNYRVFLEFISASEKTFNALLMQFAGVKRIMTANHWFDLKGRIKTEVPSRFPR